MALLNIFLLTVTVEKELLISLQGNDSATCGNDLACRTISYTLEHRANTGDTVMIDNQFSTKSIVFDISKTSTFRKNLTLKGIHGRPTISSKYPRVLFDDKYSPESKAISLKIINIWFKAVALLQFHEPTDFAFVQIIRCVISHLHQFSLIDSQQFSSDKTSSFINITIQDTNVFNFWSGIRLTGLHVRLYASNCTFSNREKSNTIITAFANMTRILSLEADFSTLQLSNLSYVFFLSQTYTERISKIRIRNSRLFAGTTYYIRFGAAMHFVNVNASFEDCIFRCNEGDLAVLLIEYSTVSFSGCHFENNFVTVDHLHLQLGVFQIRKSKASFWNYSFIKNSAGSLGTGVAVSLWSKSDIEFHNCNFISNSAGLWGGAVSIGLLGEINFNKPDEGYSYAKFQNCSFISNNIKPLPTIRRIALGGGVNSFGSSSISFRNCRFINNSASMGGAVSLYSAHKLHFNLIQDSYFEVNSADVISSGLTDDQGEETQGGAIFLHAPSTSIINISRSFFVNNKATGFGGTIMHHGGKLFLSHSKFDTSPSDGNTGNCIYSSSEIIMRNVTINETGSFLGETWLLAVAALQNDGQEDRGSNSSISCSQGRKIAVNGGPIEFVFNQQYRVYRMTNVFCSSCPAYEYSLSSGNAIFYESDNAYIAVVKYTRKNVRCLQCPLGGDCRNGRIRAANNFWGYQIKSEVRFLTCPFGYCCTGITCKRHNSCASGRQGTLCGRCDKTLIENILTTNCLEPRNCSHPWYWLAVIFAGIFYFLILMYLKEITVFLKAFLYPKNMKSASKTTLIPINEAPLLANSQNVKLEVEEDQNDTEPTTNGKSDAFFPGLLKIVIFFYQVNLLYKVPIANSSEISQGSFSVMKEILATVFNLRTDGTFYQNFSWCPIGNLTPVPKVVFKMSFIFYITSLAIITYFLAIILSFHRKALHLRESITKHLLPCCLRLAIISYATITTSLFSLVSCVHVDPSERVLFIDGNIPCFQWWQHFVIFTIICWSVCFPIAVYTSSCLLRRGIMKSKMFLLSLVFPMASVLYWLYIQDDAYKVLKSQSSNKVGVTERPVKDGSWETKTLRQLLEVVEAPFRESETSAADKTFKISWESILVTRRLVLLFAQAFIVNTLARLLTMLLLTIFFLMHHIKVQPFSHPILNYVETGSLFFLTTICALNIIPAYNYAFPLSASEFSRKFIEVFMKIETALTLIFPATAVCCITILLCIRLFQFIVWFCVALLRIICFCLKRKTS